MGVKIDHITVMANGTAMVVYNNGLVESVPACDVTIVEPTEVPVETVITDYIK